MRVEGGKEEMGESSDGTWGAERRRGSSKEEGMST